MRLFKSILKFKFPGSLRPELACNKKVVISVLALIMLVAMLVAAGCADSSEEAADSPPTSEEDIIELTLAHFQPSTHEVETVLIQGWIDAIENATDGRVQITSYPGETLLPGPEIFEGVVDGAADIGHSAYAYTRGRFPVMETFLIPGLVYENAEVADRAAMEGIELLEPEELEGVKHFFTFSTGRGDIFLQEPVRELEDLGGLQIGVTAGERADALDMLGTTGVVLPMPEHYEAIARDMTDGVIAPMETLKSFRLAEVTDHVTVTPFLYNQLLFMVMNLETWNSLPEDIQEIIEEETEDYYEEVVVGFYDRLNEEVFEWFEEEGIEMEIIKLDDEEQKRWIELVEPLFDEHVRELEEKGLPGDEILQQVIELTEKYNEEYGD